MGSELVGMTPVPGDEVADRLRGALLGLAVGDAVGTAVEFCQPGTFVPLTDMVGGGAFGLKAGEWTDDTSMALCLAESLIERSGFDPADQLHRYVRWHEEGHLSSTGECFDIGVQTREALAYFKRSGKPFCGPTDERRSGNGSLMRLSPVAIAYFRDPAAAIRYAGESSRTTHGSALCVDACRYFAGLLVTAARGGRKADVLAGGNQGIAGALAPKVHEVTAGSYLRKEPPEIRGSGYVVDCLEAALWAVHRTESFEAAVLEAANLGDDADTTAAVAGQLAGAMYGASGIPGKWLERLAKRELIERYAEGLIGMSMRLRG